MAAKVTIRDIAREAGVSVGTVSNVINGKPNVDGTITAQVRAVMDALNYRVNLHARGMSMQRSFNIGIVIPSLTDPYFPRFADSLEILIEERGSHVIITSTRGDGGRERDILDALLAKSIDGIIITPSVVENSEYLNSLIHTGTPLVQLGRYYEGIQAPVVHADNRAFGNKAAELILGIGCRELVVLAGDPKSRPDSERADAFVEAIKDSGSDAAVTRIPCSSGIEHRAYEEFSTFLRGGNAVDAVFSIDDFHALGCLKACFQSGLRIPDDVSLVSVGAFYDPDTMPLELTTFGLDPAEMAREAVELLFAMIDHRKVGFEQYASREVIIPFDFVRGETLKR